MGGKWEVAVFGQHELGRVPNYSYATVYMGNSAIAALWHFMRHRRAWGCVTIHYRNPK